MIYFAELNKTDNEHEVINACLLQMLAEIYPDEQIVFWGSERHFRQLSLEAQNGVLASFVDVLTPRDGNKLYWIWKYLNEIWLVFRLLSKARENRVRFVFFSSASVFGNYALHKIVSLFFRDIKIVITLHGELEFLRPNAGSSKIEAFLGRILKRAFQNQLESIWYLLLGSSIKRQLLKLELLSDRHILCIEHPFVFQENTPVSKTYQIPAFGHLGVAKKSKNSDLFFDLARFYKTEIENGRAKFKLIGRLWNDVEEHASSLVEYADNTDFLDRDCYNTRIQEVDYAVFLYDDINYQLTGSGAVMDALAYNKPFLCISNEFFRNLFSLSSIAPGWICDDFDQLNAKVSEIIAGKHTDRYEEQVNAIMSIKKMFSIAQVQKQLKEELCLFDKFLTK